MTETGTPNSPGSPGSPDSPDSPDTETPVPGRKPTRRRSLGRDYTHLLSAYSVQTLGEGVLIAALPLLASRLTSDPRLISWVSLAQELPWLLLALPGGVIVDRYDRRRLMIGTQAGQAFLLLIVALLASLHLEWIWLLYVLAFGLGTGDIVFTGANRSVIPAVVASADLDRANSATITAETLGRQFLGPPLGSALFAFLLPLPFWTDAVTYAFSLLLLSRIRGDAGRFRPVVAATPPRGREQWTEAMEGLRWIFHHPVLRITVTLAATSNFCVFMAQSVLVLFAKEILHIGSAGYGVLVATMAIGGILGALVSRRVVTRFGPRAVVIGVSLSSALSLLAIGIFGEQPVVVVALFCVWSAGLSLWNVMSQTLNQRLVPDRLRGRTVTGARMIAFGALPLGALAGGFVASAFGLRAPWVIGGLIHLCMALALLPAVLRWPEYMRSRGYQDGPTETST